MTARQLSACSRKTVPQTGTRTNYPSKIVQQACVTSKCNEIFPSTSADILRFTDGRISEQYYFKCLFLFRSRLGVSGRHRRNVCGRHSANRMQTAIDTGPRVGCAAWRLQSAHNNADVRRSGRRAGARTTVPRHMTWHSVPFRFASSCLPRGLFPLSACDVHQT